MQTQLRTALTLAALSLASKASYAQDLRALIVPPAISGHGPVYGPPAVAAGGAGPAHAPVEQPYYGPSPAVEGPEAAHAWHPLYGARPRHPQIPPYLAHHPTYHLYRNPVVHHPLWHHPAYHEPYYPPRIHHPQGSGYKHCRWTHGTWDMFPLVEYYPQSHGYFYFEPYNFEHFMLHTQIVGKIGGDPRNPYDNRHIDKIFDNIEAETDAESVDTGVIESVEPLPSDTPPLPPQPEPEAKEESAAPPKDSSRRFLRPVPGQPSPRVASPAPRASREAVDAPYRSEDAHSPSPDMVFRMLQNAEVREEAPLPGPALQTKLTESQNLYRHRKSAEVEPAEEREEAAVEEEVEATEEEELLEPPLPETVLRPRRVRAGQALPLATGKPAVSQVRPVQHQEPTPAPTSKSSPAGKKPTLLRSLLN